MYDLYTKYDNQHKQLQLSPVTAEQIRCYTETAGDFMHIDGAVVSTVIRTLHLQFLQLVPEVYFQNEIEISVNGVESLSLSVIYELSSVLVSL